MPEVDCEQLGAEIDAKKAEIEDYRDQHLDKIEHYEALKEELESLNEEIKPISEKLQKIAECEQGLEARGFSDADELDSAITELEGEIDEAESGMAEAEAAMQEQTEIKEAEEEALSVILEDKARAEADRDEVQTHLDAVIDEIERKEEQKAEYERLSEAVEELDDMDGEASYDEHGELQDLLNEIGSIEELQASIDQLNGDKAALEEELAREENNIQYRQEEEDDVREKIAEAERAYEEQERIYNEKGSEIRTKEVKLSDYEALKEKCSEVEGLDKDELDQRIDELAQREVEIREELGQYNFDEVIDEYEKLNDELKKLTDKHDKHCKERGDDEYADGYDEEPLEPPPDDDVEDSEYDEW